MSTVRTHKTLTNHLAIDRHGVTIAGLLVTVAACASLLARWLVAPSGGGADPSEGVAGAQASEQAALGGGYVFVVVASAVVVIAGIWLMGGLPTWLREILGDTGRYVLFALLGAASAVTFGGLTAPFLWFTIGWAGLFVALAVIDHVGLWWCLNNVLVVGLAVTMAAFVGVAFGAVFLAVALWGLTLYDEIAANRRSAMFTMADAFVRRKLPVVFVWPRTWRFEWDMLTDLDDADVERDDRPIRWGLGNGDLFLPAGLIAAVVAHEIGPVVSGVPILAVGMMGGLAVAGLRLGWELEHVGSGAGLPAISAGLVGGGVVALVVGVVV